MPLPRDPLKDPLTATESLALQAGAVTGQLARLTDAWPAGAPLPPCLSQSWNVLRWINAELSHLLEWQAGPAADDESLAAVADDLAAAEEERREIDAAAAEWDGRPDESEGADALRAAESADRAPAEGRHPQTVTPADIVGMAERAREMLLALTEIAGRGTAGPTSNNAPPSDGASFPPCQYVEPGTGLAYDFGGRRLLWELFRVLRNSRRAFERHELANLVPTWKERVVEDGAIDRAVKDLRIFFEGKGRKDIARQIRGGKVVSFGVRTT